MASARRVGTNEQIATGGDNTRTYDFAAGGLATFEAATDTDHVSDNETDVLECFDDAEFDDEINMAGGTNDATRFRLIRAAAGEGHDGTSNNGVHFNTTGSQHLLLSQESFTAFEDLILELSINTSNTRGGVTITGASARVVGCIAFDGTNAGSGAARGIQLAGDLAIAVVCLAENNAGGNFRFAPGGGNTVYAYNCTGVDNTAEQNYINIDGTVVLTNCLATTTGTDFEAGTYTGSDFNASSDTTDPDSGANNRTSQTFTFVNAGGNDYHLASGDAGAKDFGTDLSADGVFAFDDDIDGELFNVWDIGFDEPDPGGGDEVDWYMPRPGGRPSTRMVSSGWMPH